MTTWRGELHAAGTDKENRLKSKAYRDSGFAIA